MRSSRLLLLLIGAALLSACGTTITRHTLYLPAPAIDEAASLPPAVRVVLPNYVDTRVLAGRDASGALVPLETNEWAELPADGFARLLSEQLLARNLVAPGALLRAEFSRFEQDADGAFRARGSWQLRQSGQHIASGNIAIDLPLEASPPTARAIVNAMSEAVAHTAEAIVEIAAPALRARAESRTGK